MELISKEEAMDAIRAIKEVMLTNGEVINALYHVPTIESRQKGEWRTSRVHGGIVKCDFCGFQWGSNEGGKFNYCPNCGADMRGKNDKS